MIIDGGLLSDPFAIVLRRDMARNEIVGDAYSKIVPNKNLKVMG